MQCLNCGQELPKNFSILEFLWKERSEEVFCSDCQSNFQLLSGNLCYGCCKPSDVTYCSDCQIWQLNYPNYDFSHKALFVYNDAMKAYFERYKFLGDYRLRHTFGKVLRSTLSKEQAILVPIPLSNERYLERGFNQVSGMLEAAGLNFLEVLEKKEHIEHQSKKSKVERMETQQPFSLQKELSCELKGKDVLLVDDIYTTGRTIFHAYEALKTAQPKSIRSFSLAR